MRVSPVKMGDHVVHQSHPGRFMVTRIEPRPSMNVYSNVVTIRSEDGVEMKVLDTTVRRLASSSAPKPES